MITQKKIAILLMILCFLFASIGCSSIPKEIPSDITIEELRRLNPQYARDIIPGGKEYALCLPIAISGAYIDQQDSILAYQAKELIHNRRAEIDLMQRTGLNGGYSVNGVTYYKIKEGDTLGGIAAKFHVSVKRLKSFNGLSSDMIRAGKTLKIPNV